MKKLKELNKNKVKEKNGIEKYGKKRWDVNDTPYLWRWYLSYWWIDHDKNNIKTSKKTTIQCQSELHAPFKNGGGAHSYGTCSIKASPMEYAISNRQIDKIAF
jgi:hypothetical protein